MSNAVQVVSDYFGREVPAHDEGLRPAPIAPTTPSARVYWYLIELDANGAALHNSCESLRPMLFRLRSLIEAHAIEGSAQEQVSALLQPSIEELVRVGVGMLAQTAPGWPRNLAGLLESSGRQLTATLEFIGGVQLYLQLNQEDGPQYSEELLAEHLRISVPAVLQEIDAILGLPSLHPRDLLTPEMLREWVQRLGYDLELLDTNLEELVAAVDVHARHHALVACNVPPKLRSAAIEELLLEQSADPETAAAFGKELSHLSNYELPKDLAFGKPASACSDESPHPLFFEEFARSGAAVVLSVASSAVWSLIATLPTEKVALIPLFKIFKLVPGGSSTDFARGVSVSLAALLTSNPWFGFRLADFIQDTLQLLPGILFFGSFGLVASKGLFGWLAKTQRQEHESLYLRIPEDLRERVSDRPFTKPTAGPRKVFNHPCAYLLGALSLGASLSQFWALSEIDYPHFTEFYGPLSLLSGAFMTAIVLMNEARLYRGVLHEYVSDIQRAARSAHACRDTVLRKVFRLDAGIEKAVLQNFFDPVPIPPSPDGKFDLPEHCRAASDRERYLYSVERAHFLAELLTGEQRNKLVQEVLEATFHDHEHSLTEVLSVVKRIHCHPEFSRLACETADRKLNDEELRTLLNTVDVGSVTAA